MGLEFYKEEMKPQIFVGFLLNPSDHGLTFTDKARGIDLALFIECAPPSTKPKETAWIERTAAIQNKFKTVVAHNHTEIQKKYRKLTVQECLPDVIRGHCEEEVQIEAIYSRLHSWAEVLFEGGTLKAAMRETWPNSSGSPDPSSC